MSITSIKQHRVPAWPAGHPMEFQHGLLVVQESITITLTRLSSSQHQLPHRFSARQLCLEQLQRGNTSELLVNGLAIKAFFVTFRRFLCDMSRPAQFLPFTSFPKLHADKEKRLPLICDSLHIDSHASLCEALFRWPPQARCWAHCQEAGGAHSSKWRNQDRRGTNYSKDSCLATIWPVRSWRQA